MKKNRNHSIIEAKIIYENEIKEPENLGVFLPSILRGIITNVGIYIIPTTLDLVNTYFNYPKNKKQNEIKRWNKIQGLVGILTASGWICQGFIYESAINEKGWSPIICLIPVISNGLSYLYEKYENKQNQKDKKSLEKDSFLVWKLWWIIYKPFINIKKIQETIGNFV